MREWGVAVEGVEGEGGGEVMLEGAETLMMLKRMPEEVETLMALRSGELRGNRDEREGGDYVVMINVERFNLLKYLLKCCSVPYMHTLLVNIIVIQSSCIHFHKHNPCLVIKDPIIAALPSPPTS